MSGLGYQQSSFEVNVRVSPVRGWRKVMLNACRWRRTALWLVSGCVISGLRLALRSVSGCVASGLRLALGSVSGCVASRLWLVL